MNFALLAILAVSQPYDLYEDGCNSAAKLPKEVMDYSCKIHRLQMELMSAKRNDFDQILEQELLVKIVDGVPQHVTKGVFQRTNRVATINRDSATWIQENTDVLATQAQTISYFDKHGQPEGFTFIKIAPNSILSRSGLKAGDILTGIDSQKVVTSGTALALIGRLLKNGEIAICLQIIRDGEPMMLVLMVED